MRTFIQDVKYAARMLVKTPSFTAIAVLTLALGIGANTAIFTLIDALLLKMLPVKNPQQLVIVGDANNPNNRSNGTPQVTNFSYPLYQELRDHNSVFTGLAAAASEHRLQVDASQSGKTSDERVVARMVSGNYFSVLGLDSAAGRLITPEEDTAEDANPVVVLGYGYWQRRFALSPSIIGASVRLNGYPFTVIGVAPQGFDGDIVGEEMALYVPLSMQPEIVRGRHWRTAVNTSWLSLIGRLKTGITPAKAQADMNLVFQQALHGSYGARLSADDRKSLSDPKFPQIQVSPGGSGLSDLRSDYTMPLYLLMGIVGLVLLIACVNVANLLLARASARRKEVAVRLALGANRRRLLQQLLTESVLLALLGGIAGSLLAFWGVRMLVSLFDARGALPVAPDLPVLGFTLGVCLITGILFGLVPALRTLKVQVSPTLKDTANATTEPRSRFGWGKSLVVAQVAISLLVLFAAGLLVRSLQKLMNQNFGYNRDHLVIARLDPTAAGYNADKMKLLANALVDRVSSAPGVRAVTYSENGLFAHTESNDAIIVPGFNPPNIEDSVSYEDYVGPNYFGAIGIPIVEGRGIEAQDTPTSTRVAVVNQAWVKHYLNGENPIGRQFAIADPDEGKRPFTIIDISHNAKDHGSALRDEVRPRFYSAFQQETAPTQIVLEVNASGSPSALASTVVSQVKSVDPHLTIQFAQTLDDLVTSSAADQIAMAKLSAFFAGLALLLACIGLYGVMSYTVAGRTREIGVRMALGAERTNVLQLVMREGMFLVGLGLAVGIPLALASSRLLSSMLFGLKSSDPASLAIVVAILAAVATLAGYIPARRATKVNPVVALRYE
ncbi:MAG TPA: ABC transporter permease [Terriglobales bacterium]|nr:ABC transporter permease [Terriglobales bacterium]